jgi:hypothetical protein
MAKVVTNSNLVLIHAMKDGDVAEIVQSDIGTLKVGTIIQRFEDRIILIGERSGLSYPRLIKSSQANESHICVTILPKGTLIQL